MGPIYTEWRATCDMTLGMVCKLLQGANPSLELVEFISTHKLRAEIVLSIVPFQTWLAMNIQ